MTNIINSILQLPARCLLQKKITKAFFKRNFELTLAERKLLDNPDAFIQIEWVATISPETANINAYSDDESIYEEVQVISLSTHQHYLQNQFTKLAGFGQKYIPYPVLLYIYAENQFRLNTAEKKINQNDPGKRTIGKDFYSEVVDINSPSDAQENFLQSLQFSKQDTTNLKTFYNSYSQSIVALQAAEVTGTFQLRTQQRTEKDMENLEKIETLQHEMNGLLKQAQQETQLNKQVEINMRVQQVRREIENLQRLIMTS